MRNSDPFYLLPLLCISLFFNPIWTFDWAMQFYPIAFQTASILTFFVALLVWRKNKQLVKFNAIDCLVVAYYLYNIIISTWRNGNLKYDADIISLIAFLLTYLSVRVLCQGTAKRVVFFWILLCFTFFNAIFGISQISGINDVDAIFGTIMGTFNNSGPFGGYIALGVPISIFFFLKSKTHYKKSIHFIIVCVLFAAILLSSSRAALLSCLVAILVIVIPLHKNRFRDRPKSLIFGILTIFVLLTISLYQIRPASANGRILIWTVSSTMITPSSILGNGIGYFNDQYNYFQAIYLCSAESSQDEKLLAGYVHSPFNEFIRTLIEFGIPGILLMLCLIFVVVKRIFTAKLDLESATPIASWLSLLVFAQFSYPFQLTPIHTMFCLLLGLIAANYDVHFWEIPVKKSSRIILPFFFISVVLLLQIHRGFNSLVKWRSANTAISYNLAYALETYKGLRSEMSNSYTFLYNYGSELANLGYYKNALDVYKELNRFHYNKHLYSQMGRCYEEMKIYDKAEACYKTASCMEPVKLSPQVLLFQLFINSGQVKKAIDQAKAILATPVKIKTAEAEKIRREMRLYLLTQSGHES